MAGLRVSVEWGYKEVKQVFTRLDVMLKLKIRAGPVALVYRCAALLWNMLTSLYGSQTASFSAAIPQTWRLN